MQFTFVYVFCRGFDRHLVCDHRAYCITASLEYTPVMMLSFGSCAAFSLRFVNSSFITFVAYLFFFGIFTSRFRYHLAASLPVMTTERFLVPQPETVTAVADGRRLAARGCRLSGLSQNFTCFIDALQSIREVETTERSSCNNKGFPQRK
jgi:hypothetical protein